MIMNNEAKTSLENLQRIKTNGQTLFI